jgi:hypothetical protein
MEREENYKGHLIQVLVNPDPSHGCLDCYVKAHGARYAEKVGVGSMTESESERLLEEAKKLIDKKGE